MYRKVSHKTTSTQTENRTMHDTGAKPDLSFSIANILKVEEPAKSSLTSKNIDSEGEVLNKGSRQVKGPVTSNLPWLAYTRYCPPKIPSK